MELVPSSYFTPTPPRSLAVLSLWQWAMLCRYIGTLNPKEFEQVQNEIMPDPDVAKRNLNRLFHRTDALIDIPLVSLGPSGIGGKYQREKIE